MPGREPVYRPGHPLPADLVIVDESSMLNLRLLEVLLGALAESTHIVLVGDADQLPPIGAGKPFEDLIASEAAPVVRLNQIFRQAARSMITTAAHEINQGRPPHLEPTENQDHDFFFIDRPSPERALETVVEVVAERAPKRFAVDPIREVQVLAPMYKGVVGIDALNERLQARLNPDGKPALNDRFRIGDRLIQTRNSHELGLMNGSIVFLCADEPGEEAIVVDTDEGGSLVIPYGETATLQLAYAISVHKAQGCEVPVVVGVCHRSHSRMLTRPRSTPQSPGRATAAYWSATAPSWPPRWGVTTAAAGTRGWRRGCAADPFASAGDGADRRRYFAGEGKSQAALPLAEIGVTLAGIALLAALVLAVAPLRDACGAAIHGDTAEVRLQIDNLGVAGPLLIIALTLIHAVIFYPAEIVDAAAGFAYGFFPALLLVMSGWLLSALLCFAIGRSVARPLLDRWVGEERFERIEAAIERGGATLLIGMRLIPIFPFSIVCYAAGAARVPVWRFIWTTAVGYLPITAISVYFGTRLEGLSLTDPLVIGTAAGLLALLLGGHWVMRRQAARSAS